MPVLFESSHTLNPQPTVVTMSATHNRLSQNIHSTKNIWFLFVTQICN